jgi:hypothetical protein
MIYTQAGIVGAVKFGAEDLATAGNSLQISPEVKYIISRGSRHDLFR